MAIEAPSTVARNEAAVPAGPDRATNDYTAYGLRVRSALPPLPRVAKPCTVRRLCAVDVAELRSRVGRLTEAVWRREDAGKENDFFCFHHTRHIVFRFIHGARTPWSHYSKEPLWTILRPLLLPVMAQAAAPYGYAEPVYPKAMLARLAAGHGIDRHVDAGGSNLLVHKIHVPLESNPRATMTVDGTEFHLEVGYAFEVNNLLPHGAFNGGAEDRIHFIFEVFEGAQPGRGGSAPCGSRSAGMPPEERLAADAHDADERDAMPSMASCSDDTV